MGNGSVANWQRDVVSAGEKSSWREKNGEIGEKRAKHEARIVQKVRIKELRFRSLFAVYFQNTQQPPQSGKNVKCALKYVETSECRENA